MNSTTASITYFRTQAQRRNLMAADGNSMTDAAWQIATRAAVLAGERGVRLISSVDYRAAFAEHDAAKEAAEMAARVAEIAQAAQTASTLAAMAADPDLHPAPAQIELTATPTPADASAAPDGTVWHLRSTQRLPYIVRKDAGRYIVSTNGAGGCIGMPRTWQGVRAALRKYAGDDLLWLRMVMPVAEAADCLASAPAHEGMHADDVPADIDHRLAAIAYMRDGEADFSFLAHNVPGLDESTMRDLVAEGICGTQVAYGQNSYWLIGTDTGDDDPVPPAAQPMRKLDADEDAIVQAIRGADLYRAEIIYRLARRKPVGYILSATTVQRHLDHMVATGVLHAIRNMRGRSYIVADAYHDAINPQAVPVAAYRTPQAAPQQAVQPDGVIEPDADARAILAALDGTQMDSAMLMATTGLDIETIGRLLARLQDRGQVRRIGAGNGRSIWQAVAPEYRMPVDRMQATLVALMDRYDAVRGLHADFEVRITRYQAGAIGVEVRTGGQRDRAMVASAEEAARWLLDMQGSAAYSIGWFENLDS